MKMLYWPAGFLLDFKDFKNIVNRAVVELFDHKLVLSKLYRQAPGSKWTGKPGGMGRRTHCRKPAAVYEAAYQKELPGGIALMEMNLYETQHSYATWRE